MARIITAGAETGYTGSGSDTTAPDGFNVSGTVTASAGSARSGALGYSANSGAGPATAYRGWNIAGSFDLTYHMRFFARFAAFPSATVQIARIRSAASAQLLTVRLTSTGTLQLWNEPSAVQIGSDSAALSLNQWAQIEIALLQPTAGNATVGARLNGTDFVPSTTATLTGAASGQYHVGIVAPNGVTTFQMDFDDVALNDSTAGAGQTSWCGNGQVVLLRPTADSSRVGWTDGAGGTSALWDAVNNTPPTGSASPGATTQIKDTASNTTDTYVATLATYTAAGVPAGSTVTTARIIGNIGQVGTSAHSFGLASSNPTIAEVTRSGTAAAAGTFPTNWVWATSGFSYLPAPTLGSAPTITVRKNTSDGTNASYVDAVGLIVEYVPPSAGEPGFRFGFS